ncbi:MAG: DUF6577 family protein [Candidatus Bathyarchaeia archaeon]|jgi:hypothetical protein|nr:hypothetical protein [Candidatus Bathyarchaeota archaeon A05DMB-5]
MKWENTALEILRSEFNNRIFRADDVFKLLNEKKGYSRGTAHRVLHDLCKKGLIERLGRDIYKVSKIVKFKETVMVSASVSVDLIPGSLTKARDLLRNKGIEFMITGGSSLYRFFHHLPKRLIHLIYVKKGSGEVAVTLLREAEIRALLNPSLSEINVALENFPERDIFVIREFTELPSNIDGNASIERALVDLYFESTRKRIPFPEEEAGRILSKVLRTEPINFSHLLMLAARRGIREEMEAIAKFVRPELPIKGKSENKYAKRVIEAMEVLR